MEEFISLPKDLSNNTNDSYIISSFTCRKPLSFINCLFAFCAFLLFQLHSHPELSEKSNRLNLLINYKLYINRTITLSLIRMKLGCFLNVYPMYKEWELEIFLLQTDRYIIFMSDDQIYIKTIDFDFSFIHLSELITLMLRIFTKTANFNSAQSMKSMFSN